ncbi:ubiquitin carboxyl-terminal hydrolase family protein, putative [Ichthyophthirius multifiliis]|uniref:ubiquitinyl hydrolase 1 n=1 Tax=Ichthyophthirius multifiliis TaxID=5932 RepID=G0QWL4_ICHMU|nr:ubiquitin carboxyl-terminal hydrolase family protein, putative [Ichthyophthirius multifiliis]EGR30389.1 ubiquitin carboxyl-terminal hydrolase family protein, putative [Ichthyophthirius multifiliis]|eukprot:XP_004031976.1 ubiquitin carboxyl-terminal hydrolase family protein, putative [Ichthyophthirius multifiliis]
MNFQNENESTHDRISQNQDFLINYINPIQCGLEEEKTELVNSEDENSQIEQIISNQPNGINGFHKVVQNPQFTTEELIKQANQFNILWKEFNQQFISSDCNEYYILSNQWLDQWKLNVSYDDVILGKEINTKYFGKQQFEIANIELIQEECNKKNELYYPVKSEEQYEYYVLKPNLVENQDFIFVNKKIIDFFISLKYSIKKIKRQAYHLQNGKKLIQIYYKQHPLLILNHQLLKDIDQKSLDSFSNIKKVQIFSGYNILQLKEYLCFFVNQYQHNNSQFSIIQANTPENIRLWQLGLDQNLQQLFQHILTSVNRTNNYDYKFNSTLINLEKKEDIIFEDLNFEENNLLIIEVQKDSNMGMRDFFFKLEGESDEQQCEYCQSYKVLKVLCKCKTVSYCSENCKLKDITYHSRKCEYAVEDSEEDENDLSPYQFKEQSVKGLCGLNNLGNTCYMNSALQCLSNTEPLTHYFLNKYYKKEINKDNPLGTKGKLKLWIGTDRVFYPSAIKNAVSQVQNIFSGYQQHDSQEFLSFVLDGLHEDLNRVKNKSYTEKIDSNGEEFDNIISKKSWINHLKRNQSLIVDLMQGQFKSKVICPDCSKQSITFDPFLTCTLPIPHQQIKVLDFYYIPVNNRIICTSDQFNFYENSTQKVQELKNYFARKYKVNQNRLLLCMNENQLAVIKDEEFLKDVYRKNKQQRNKVILFELEQSQQNQDDILMFIEITYFKKNISFPYKHINRNLKKQVCFPRPFYFQKDISANKIHLIVFESLKQLILRSEDFSQNYLDDLKLLSSQEFYYKYVLNEEQNQKFYQLNININKHLNEQNIQNYLQEEDDEDAQNFPYKIDEKQTLQQLIEQANEKECNISLECFFPLDSEINYEELNALSIPEKGIINEEVLIEQQLQQKENISIYECFNQFQQSEKLEENNEWYCSDCKAHKRATKQMTIYRVPNILIIHLKRFKMTGGIWNQKLTKLVTFPVEGLDITDYVVKKELPSYYYENHTDLNDDEEIKNLYVKPDFQENLFQKGQIDIEGEDNSRLLFDLYAAVNHFGGLGGGHYTAFALNNGEWYCFDDQSVQKIDQKDVCSESSYILFYKKR